MKKSITFLIAITSFFYCSAQTQIKHVCAAGGKITTGKTYQNISVIGEMAVSSFSGSVYSGSIGYLSQDTSERIKPLVSILPLITGVIQIFPNPNNGSFTLSFENNMQFEDSKIEIFDMSGRSVYQDAVKLCHCSQIEINTQLTGGLYLLSVSNQTTIFTKLISVF